MSSHDNIPAAIGDDQSLHSPSSSAPPSPESMNETHLADKAAAAEELSADEAAIIFSFLTHQDIMRARVCKTWRDAAKKTLVPLCEFRVESVRSYNAMRVMATALPNLQQISIHSLRRGHKYSDGEDAYERVARHTADYSAHDINIISSFTKLRVLHIDEAPLNGSYPVLFSFSLLEKLIIKDCEYLKWDLEMLQGLHSLKELDFNRNSRLTGNLSSLGALKDSLEKVRIHSYKLSDSFMDLADFPRLKELDLYGTTVTGHIGDIRGQDFPTMESLVLPESVHGGMYYEFQSISDVPSFMHTIHLLLQRTPTLFDKDWLSGPFFGWSLSERSPDWYDGEMEAWVNDSPLPPFKFKVVQAGSRRGWSWCSCSDYDDENECHSCEINWLDPEPSSESSDYEAYIEALKRIERRIDFYRGYYDPPTELQYRRLCEGEG
eukprot:scaffold3078_cov83-Skeletonema_dohrnii-CCMP3373.AAC.3